jgi:hypothetical protein
MDPMNNHPLPLRALWSALGVTAYVALVAVIISNGERIFNHLRPGIIGPLAFLLLFVFSALLTGTLVLLPPARLYFDGRKTEGIRLLLYTAGWLGVMTIVVLIILASI